MSDVAPQLLGQGHGVRASMVCWQQISGWALAQSGWQRPGACQLQLSPNCAWLYIALCWQPGWAAQGLFDGLAQFVHFLVCSRESHSPGCTPCLYLYATGLFSDVIHLKCLFNVVRSSCYKVLLSCKHSSCLHWRCYLIWYCELIHRNYSSVDFKIWSLHVKKNLWFWLACTWACFLETDVGLKVKSVYAKIKVIAITYAIPPISDWLRYL